MLKDFIPRPYQLSIFKSATLLNTLVVLPTGLGKTAISMLLAARRKISYPESKILFIAPTKPLVEQQLESFQKAFEIDKINFSLFTGSVLPKKRHELWESSQYIFSTPQTIENDVLSGNISLEDVSLLVIDEAHRAVGDYAYVFLAKEYAAKAKHQRILALTASPGTDEDKIRELMKNLSIEKIEYRKPDDKEVTPYSQETKVFWEQVDLDSEHRKIITYLQKSYESKLEKINTLKETPLRKTENKATLLKLQSKLHGRISKEGVSMPILQTISLLAEALKVQHAIELAETQTIYALHDYLYNILVSARSSKTKAVKNLAKDPNFLGALALVREAQKQNKEHPKLQKLIDKVAIITQQKKDAKIIIFTQFRDTATHIEKILNQITPSQIFFGQAKKNGIGFSQKQQKETLQNFREGKFNCLIATSVAEEGLDIPSVDHVFFYEPIPSAIRSVQRRGRTGRHTTGYVTIFLARGTRDEAYRWVAFHKEKRMYEVLEKLTTKMNTEDFKNANQSSLSEFSSQTISVTKALEKKETNSKESIIAKTSKLQIPKIIGDFREKGSPVLKNLLQEEVEFQLKQLAVGDFLLSKDCCVEFKNTRDFVDSIVDGRLLSQLRQLVQYSKPILILEGDQEELLNRNISYEAVMGMIATISTSYKIPRIRTFSPRETAKMLVTIAKREQDDSEHTFTYHTAKPLVDKDLQEYIVSSLPGVGGSLAKALLNEFDSIDAIFNASIGDLKKVDLIGIKKATEIYRMIHLSHKFAKDLFKKDILPDLKISK